MNRHNPIQETIQTIKGYPSSLIIYKMNASKNYWVRLYYNKKNHYKSTQTESVSLAKQFAVDFYKSILVDAVVTKTTNNNKAFSLVGNHFFTSTEKNTSKRVYQVDYARYKQHILPVFNQQDIDSITNAQISNFVSKLQTTGIKPATIKHHIIVLRKIMRFAVANDLMSTLPVFPKIQGKLKTTQRRDYLTQDEYKHLVTCTDELIKKNTVVRGIPMTLEMKYLIQFMVNSFIRPSDLRVLQHKHISLATDGKDKWLRLNHPATKTNANEVQTMPTARFIYRDLMKFKEETKSPATPDDYVFFPTYKNRTTAMNVIGRMFKEIVQESKIKQNTDKVITLYSLRHSSIMYQLLRGNANTLAIARNARTSQSMIDLFYASHLTTNQVREQLHKFPQEEAKKARAKEEIDKLKLEKAELKAQAKAEKEARATKLAELKAQKI